MDSLSKPIKERDGVVFLNKEANTQTDHGDERQKIEDVDSIIK